MTGIDQAGYPPAVAELLRALRSEEHTSELQSPCNIVCRLLLEKKKKIDHRSDIFSFGCVLFEAATGQKPFAGESIIKSLHKIENEPSPAIADLNPSAPPYLQRI